MTTPKLTATMREALTRFVHDGNGELRRWPGGFWTFAGALEVKPGVPEWYVVVNTVHALIKRGLVELRDVGRGFLTEGSVTPMGRSAVGGAGHSSGRTDDPEADRYASHVYRALVNTGIAEGRAEELLQHAEKSVRAWHRGYVTPEDAARKLRRGGY
jgi:hypothetical protein